MSFSRSSPLPPPPPLPRPVPRSTPPMTSRRPRSPLSCWCTARSPIRRAGTVSRRKLSADGYKVVAAANFLLRSVADDAKYVSSIVDSISGPVVLVGHSYGGQVISNVTVGDQKVKAFVYVAGLRARGRRERRAALRQFPGSTRGRSAGSAGDTAEWRQKDS